MNNLFFPPIIAPLKFYAVVPDADWVCRMIDAGVNTVQLRAKNLPENLRRQEIRRCVQAASGSNTQLFINDYWREAIEGNAYGVHLGQEDMDTADLSAVAKAGLRLGLSTHADSELNRALAVHPSYVACGVSSLAVVRAITEAKNPEQTVKDFQALWDK